MITSTPCEVFEGEKTFCEWRVTLKKRSKIRLLFTALPQIYFTTIKGHNFLFAVTHSHFNFTFNHKSDIFWRSGTVFLLDWTHSILPNQYFSVTNTTPITQGTFTYVAVGDDGKKRKIHPI